MSKTRPVKKLFVAEPQREGRGAYVRRSIGSGSCRQFDPFLLLDEFSVRKPAGFPKYVYLNTNLAFTAGLASVRALTPLHTLTLTLTLTQSSASWAANRNLHVEWGIRTQR